MYYCYWKVFSIGKHGGHLFVSYFIHNDRSSILTCLHDCTSSIVEIFHQHLMCFDVLMVTNLAVLHWTISNWFISPFLQGSQGEQAYSSDGLIRDFFTEVELALRFRFRKPIVLLDFVQTFWKWYFHFNSSLIEKDNHGGRSSIWLDVYFEWQTERYICLYEKPFSIFLLILQVCRNPVPNTWHRWWI